jgi:hypothetical protein
MSIAVIVPFWIVVVPPQNKTGARRSVVIRLRTMRAGQDDALDFGAASPGAESIFLVRKLELTQAGFTSLVALSH